MGMWDKIKKSAGNLADNVSVMVGEFSAESAKIKMQTASKGTPEYAALQKQVEIAKENVERSKAAIKHRNAMLDGIDKEEATLNTEEQSKDGELEGIEAEMDGFEPMVEARERPQDIQDIVDKMDARIQEREGITLEEKVAQERKALREARERGEPAPSSILDELNNKEPEELSPEEAFKLNIEEEFSSIELEDVQRTYNNKVRQTLAEDVMIKQGLTDGIENPEVDSMEKVGIATQVLSEKMGVDMPELPDEGLTVENVKDYTSAFSDSLSNKQIESGVSLQMEVSKEHEGQSR